MRILPQPNRRRTKKVNQAVIFLGKILVNGFYARSVGIDSGIFKGMDGEASHSLKRGLPIPDQHVDILHTLHLDHQ